MNIGYGWRVLALAGWVAATGCAGREIYAWGEYEDRVFAGLRDPGTLAEQRQRLTEEVREAEAGLRRVPPGVYAHLGYLAAEAGDAASARRYFAAERKAFPESAVFMDRLIAKLGGES